MSSSDEAEYEFGDHVRRSDEAEYAAGDDGGAAGSCFADAPESGDEHTAAAGEAAPDDGLEEHGGTGVTQAAAADKKKKKKKKKRKRSSAASAATTVEGGPSSAPAGAESAGEGAEQAAAASAEKARKKRKKKKRKRKSGAAEDGDAAAAENAEDGGRAAKRLRRAGGGDGAGSEGAEGEGEDEEAEALAAIARRRAKKGAAGALGKLRAFLEERAAHEGAAAGPLPAIAAAAVGAGSRAGTPQAMAALHAAAPRRARAAFGRAASAALGGASGEEEEEEGPPGAASCAASSRGPPTGPPRAGSWGRWRGWRGVLLEPPGGGGGDRGALGERSRRRPRVGPHPRAPPPALLLALARGAAGFLRATGRGPPAAPAREAALRALGVRNVVHLAEEAFEAAPAAPAPALLLFHAAAAPLAASTPRRHWPKWLLYGRTALAAAGLEPGLRAWAAAALRDLLLFAAAGWRGPAGAREIAATVAAAAAAAGHLCAEPASAERLRALEAVAALLRAALRCAISDQATQSPSAGAGGGGAEAGVCAWLAPAEAVLAYAEREGPAAAAALPRWAGFIHEALAALAEGFGREAAGPAPGGAWRSCAGPAMPVLPAAPTPSPPPSPPPPAPSASRAAPTSRAPPPCAPPPPCTPPPRRRPPRRLRPPRLPLAPRLPALLRALGLAPGAAAAAAGRLFGAVGALLRREAETVRDWAGVSTPVAPAPPRPGTPPSRWRCGWGSWRGARTGAASPSRRAARPRAPAPPLTPAQAPALAGERCAAPSPSSPARGAPRVRGRRAGPGRDGRQTVPAGLHLAIRADLDGVPIARRALSPCDGSGEGVAEERVFVPEECLRSLAERRSGRLTLSPEATAPGLLGPDAQAPGPSVRLASAAAPAGTVPEELAPDAPAPLEAPEQAGGAGAGWEGPAAGRLLDAFAAGLAVRPATARAPARALGAAAVAAIEWDALGGARGQYRELLERADDEGRPVEEEPPPGAPRAALATRPALLAALLEWGWTWRRGGAWRRPSTSATPPAARASAIRAPAAPPAPALLAALLARAVGRGGAAGDALEAAALLEAAAFRRPAALAALVAGPPERLARLAERLCSEPPSAALAELHEDAQGEMEEALEALFREGARDEALHGPGPFPLDTGRVAVPRDPFAGPAGHRPPQHFEFDLTLPASLRPDALSMGSVVMACRRFELLRRLHLWPGPCEARDALLQALWEVHGRHLGAWLASCGGGAGGGGVALRFALRCAARPGPRPRPRRRRGGGPSGWLRGGLCGAGGGGGGAGAGVAGAMAATEAAVELVDRAWRAAAGILRGPLVTDDGLVPAEGPPLSGEAEAAGAVLDAALPVVAAGPAAARLAEAAAECVAAGLVGGADFSRPGRSAGAVVAAGRLLVAGPAARWAFAGGAAQRGGSEGYLGRPVSGVVSPVALLAASALAAEAQAPPGAPLLRALAARLLAAPGLPEGVRLGAQGGAGAGGPWHQRVPWAFLLPHLPPEDPAPALA
eukprot:tig00000383_g24713.t1